MGGLAGADCILISSFLRATWGQATIFWVLLPSRLSRKSGEPVFGELLAK